METVEKINDTKILIEVVRLPFKFRASFILPLVGINCTTSEVFRGIYFLLCHHAKGLICKKLKNSSSDLYEPHHAVRITIFGKTLRTKKTTDLGLHHHIYRMWLYFHNTALTKAFDGEILANHS